MDDKIVCGFIAEMEHSMRLTNGLPPGQTWILSSLVIVKIVDALNRAGYTGQGKRLPNDTAVTGD